MTAVTEHRFRAMAVDVHVVVVDGPADAALRAETRVRDLEDRWSRFLPGSEVTSLNRAGGRPVAVSTETVALMAAAREGWTLTGGAFDPTVRPSVVAAGYPTPDAAEAGRAGPAPGCGGIEIDAAAGTVRFPSGVSFDPGGIGKGLAADLVVGELLEAGASGAMVNLGGDLRVSGSPPAGVDGWTVAVEDPFHPAAEIWRPTLADGGVASSSVRIRTWERDGRTRHHLVDPSTGGEPESDVVAATVVAGTAWLAEVFTKVAMTRSAHEAIEALDDAGLAGVVVDAAGRLNVGSRIGAFA